MYVKMAQTFSLICNSLGEMDTADLTNQSSEFNHLIYNVCLPYGQNFSFGNSGIRR